MWNCKEKSFTKKYFIDKQNIIKKKITTSRIQVVKIKPGENKY